MALTVIYDASNMSTASFNFTPTYSYGDDPNSFVLYGSGTSVETGGNPSLWLQGTELTDDGTGASRVLTGGTLHAVQFYDATGILYNITNPSPIWAADVVYDFFAADDTQGLFEYLLSGNDTLTASDQVQRINGYDGNDSITAIGGNDKLYGMDGNDTLMGQLGNDGLWGGAGLDKLNGGAGGDSLWGGAGADKFIFDTPLSFTGVDFIKDFTHLSDKVQLEGSIFSALGANGAVATGKFVSRTDITATSTVGIDGTDRLLYDRDSGKLYYDANGSLAGQRTLIIDFDGTPAALVAISAADFAVI